MNDLNKEKIDSIVMYHVVKKLVTPITKSKAFKLGLVDNNGVVIRKPVTDEEKNSLTMFDRFMFKLKRLLGSKVSQLHSFLYLQSVNQDFFKNLIVTGNVDKRAEVQRLKRDMENMLEKYDTNWESVNSIMMAETMKEKMSVKREEKKKQLQEEYNELMRNHFKFRPKPKIEE